jgi:ribose 5-phosphate isomerase A
LFHDYLNKIIYLNYQFLKDHQMINSEKEKQRAALEAVKFINDGHVVGLGTGSSAYYAVIEIGELIKKGLNIKGIPTSIKTKELAESLDIPLIDINSVHSIDVTIDGADEFTEKLELIKGGGGALLREKVVASMTKQMIIIADSSKKVERLGKFHLPVEVIPFAATYVMDQLKMQNGSGVIRNNNDMPFLTDQGNYIIDTDFGLISNPVALSEKLNEIVGLVEHGLFINLATRVIMGTGTVCVIFESE